MSAQPSVPVLVGRGSERVFLREELATALTGRGRLILLGGEAGIGKTTLARDLVIGAMVRGALVLTGHCYDLTNTPPYGPWLDLFANYRVENGPPPPAPFVGGRLRGTITDQAALFEEVNAFFADLSAVRPVLILLEDLHWADPASIELLRYLGTRVGRLPLLLVITYRVDELTRRHPLSRQLPALIRESEGLRLDLRRLSLADLRELVSAQFPLSTADEARLVHYLGTHAEGNPFFATELLRALREARLLQPAAAGWVLGGLDHLVMPSLLTQVIDGRIARLGDETRGPLAIAAVIGQEVPLALWSEVGAIDEETLFAIVEQAVDANLMEAKREGTHVRFVHALTREALYESVLPARRRLWHGKIADALAVQPDADPDTVAAHLQRAGDPRAVDWLIRAGDRAQRAYALVIAAERFRAAALLLEGVAGRERQRALLLYRLARLLRFSHPVVGIAELGEAERLAAAAGDPMLAADARYSRGILRFYADDWGGGIRDTDAGITVLEGLSEEEAHAIRADDVWLADSLPSQVAAGNAPAEAWAMPLFVNGVHHRRGGTMWFVTMSGRLAEARAIAEQFVADVAPDQSMGSLADSALGHAWQGLGSNYAMQGRPDDARTAFAQARERYRMLDHHAVILYTLLTELRDVELPYGADDPMRRRRLAVEAEAVMGQAGGALQPGLSPRLTSLVCLVLDGRWDEALAILAELPPIGHSLLRREITATVATLARHQGEPDLARATIAAVLPEGPATAPGTQIFQEALFLQRLAADLAIDAGDLPTAHIWLDAHDRWLAWSGAVLGRADGRLGWAVYHLASGDTRRARSCLTAALALASAPRQPLALLTAHRLLGALAAESDDENEAVRHLQTALDLAEACAAPFERALTLLALAELSLVRRKPDEAALLLDEVRAICTPLRARPVLARLDNLAERLAVTPRDERLPFGLTAREGEVLRLVAEGLTDAAIAERLFISPRTVGQHLRSIYPKLDVPSRSAATRFALDHGLA